MGIKWNDSNKEWNTCWILFFFFKQFFPIFPKFIIQQKLQHHSTHFIYNLNLMCWKIKFYDYDLRRHSSIMNSMFVWFWTTFLRIWLESAPSTCVRYAAVERNVFHFDIRLVFLVYLAKKCSELTEHQVPFNREKQKK